MKLLVVLSTHYVRASDGHVYTNGPHRRSFWERYLTVFDEALVLARVRRQEQPDAGWVTADGPHIAFWDLPDHAGAKGYLAARSPLRALVRQAVSTADAYLLRSGGSALTGLVWKEVRRRRRPYGVEVTDDPWFSLAPGATKSWARPIGRWLYVRNLKLQCRHAAAVAYVTRETLQRRYPPGPDAFTTHYSSVEMGPDAYVSQPRTFSEQPSRLVFVGSLAHLQKGADVFVQTVAACRRRGADVTARMIGDGARRRDVEEMASSLGVADRIMLLGHVSDPRALLAELDAADLFVLASRQEGLPRSVIEAMGRALPCVGTDVGGTAELIGPEELAPCGDAEALADRIVNLLGDPRRMERLSARNLKIAADFRAELLGARRREMYQRLRALCEGRPVGSQD